LQFIQINIIITTNDTSQASPSRGVSAEIEPFACGGQYFNDQELEVVHKHLFIPLQIELRAKGMLVIDGIDIFA
jgi:hypothetical protein